MPNDIYQAIFDIIKTNQIPLELLVEGKFKKKYDFIIQKDFRNQIIQSIYGCMKKFSRII